MMLRSVVVLAVAVMVTAGPMTMYEKNNNTLYQPVLVAVSSTVIPLDDLPEIKVGSGVQFVTPAPGQFKPDQPTKLITIHSLKKNKNKKAGSAKIEEITAEEYKKLISQ